MSSKSSHSPPAVCQYSLCTALEHAVACDSADDGSSCRGLLFAADLLSRHQIDDVDSVASLTVQANHSGACET